MLIIIRNLVKSFKTKDSRLILVNLLWLFADKIARQGLNFIISAYIARHLGVTLFGLWNYAIAFVMLWGFLSSLGIYNQLLRDFIKYPENRNQLLGSAFVIKLIGGCLTFTFSLIAVYIVKPDQPFLHALIAITALGYVFQSLDVIDFFFQSQLKARWTTIARLISFLIFSILKVTFIYLKLSLIYFALAQIGELLISGLILIILFGKHFESIFRWKTNWKFAKDMLLESMPILFAEVAILLYMRIDQVMIGEMLGDSSLGIFSAAVKLSEIWYMVPTVICSAFFPSIVKSHLSNAKEYKIKLQNLYDILTWSSLSIALIVSFFAKDIIILVYGSVFLEASAILTVHIWASIFVFIGYAGNQQLVLENAARINLYRTLFGVGANISFNFFLIPMYGSIGAAIATLISQAFANCISSLFFKESRSIFWMEFNALNIIRIIKGFTLKYNKQ